MKIDPTLKTVAPNAVNEQRVQNEKAPAQTAGKPRGEVELSSLSTQLQGIEASLETGQAVDSTRVAEVKKAIAEGRFEINADTIADRLIDATREFMRAHKS
jgi:negative regulator of flagellin synthesis FlgM